MVALFHLTGNANVKAAAMGLLEAGLLAEFHVSIASFPGSVLDKLGDIKPLAEIKRRSFDSSLEPYTRTSPWKEVGRLFAIKAGLNSLIKKESGIFFIDNLVTSMDRNMARRVRQKIPAHTKAIYGYEDCTSLTFKAAKEKGLKCLYDLPIGYWRKAHQILEGEREKYPNWSGTFPDFKNSQNKLQRKEEELQQADHIFVASSFTASTLNLFPGTLAPVSTIPYGFPEVRNISRTYSGRRFKGRLKLLFVGSLTQRKGIANLFSAVEQLNNYVELTLVGYKSTEDCEALNKALSKHRWIPTLAHDKVLALMRESDVLVFPSLFEGFGLVITEAMSQGTPVLTTERTAGPDLIENETDGWIVEASSTEALKAAIERLIEYPVLIEEVGRNAMKTAAARPWRLYQEELALKVREAINQ